MHHIQRRVVTGFSSHLEKVSKASHEQKELRNSSQLAEKIRFSMVSHLAKTI